MHTGYFEYLKPQSVKLKGSLGSAFYSVVENRLKKINFDTLVRPFITHCENDNGWRGEFWGKVIRSLILAYRTTQDSELKKIVDNAVDAIIAAQSSTGRISSYPSEKQLDGWDIWGRKYVLVGLIRYYEMVNASEKVKTACCGIIDDLMRDLGPGKRSITSCGQHDGLAAASILGSVVGVYRITGERKYLDYAQWIISTGCSTKHDIFNAARHMIHPAEIGNGKAYEMMSCFKGLSEYYIFEPDAESLNSLVNFFHLVRDREIFITGTGGLTRFGETWYEGAFRQTWLEKDAGKLGETCITVTWIHFCDHILRLTGDAAIADEIEKSLYNGILGAMTPDAVDWCHRNPTPLSGSASKIPADDQILRNFGTPLDGHDCCRAQGPEALANIPVLAVMNSPQGPVVNLYENLEAEFLTPGDNVAKMIIGGSYPWRGDVSIQLNLSCQENFELLLRIPGWCNTGLKINIGNTVFVGDPGTYLRIRREWQNGDIVHINFDLTPKIIRDKGNSNLIALVSGPVVLARDSRLSDVNASVPNEIPSRCSSSQGFNALWQFRDGSYLCDYASAGNLFRPDNTLRVWLELQNERK